MIPACAPGQAAADLTLQVLFDPARAARIVQYAVRTPPSSLSLTELLESVSTATAIRAGSAHTMSSEVARAVEFRALDAMLALAVNPATSSQARAIARAHVESVLRQFTSTPAPTDPAEAIHRAALIERIHAFQHDAAPFVPAPQIEAPPGMPIGEDEEL